MAVLEVCTVIKYLFLIISSSCWWERDISFQQVNAQWTIVLITCWFWGKGRTIYRDGRDQRAEMFPNWAVLCHAVFGSICHCVENLCWQNALLSENNSHRSSQTTSGWVLEGQPTSEDCARAEEGGTNPRAPSWIQRGDGTIACLFRFTHRVLPR